MIFVKIFTLVDFGAGSAILENYENMMTLPKLNLSELLVANMMTV